jgi:hypothetical protein
MKKTLKYIVGFLFASFALGSCVDNDDVVVNYTAPSDAEAFGIFAKAADGFTLTNSEINFKGTNHDYTDIHQYGLHVADSNDVEIIENEFIFHKKGIYNVTAYNKKNKLYKILNTKIIRLLSTY